MASITTRAGKGSPLTNAELDANFNNLNNEKVETSAVQVASGKTLTVSNSITLAGVDGKTLTANNNLTLIGTDGTTQTFPSSNAVIARTDAAQTFTGDQVFAGNITLNTQGDVRFADADSSNWVAFQAPATVTSNVTWTLPATDGTSGQVLTTNGSGVLSFVAPGITTGKAIAMAIVFG